MGRLPSEFPDRRLIRLRSLLWGASARGNKPRMREFNLILERLCAMG
jgi:hypothetical protein